MSSGVFSVVRRLSLLLMMSPNESQSVSLLYSLGVGLCSSSTVLIVSSTGVWFEDPSRHEAVAVKYCDIPFADEEVY